MQMGEELQIVAGVAGNLLLLEDFCRRPQNKIVMLTQEAFDDGAVLLGQDAAGGIHEATARPHQTRSRSQNGRLLLCELGNTLRCLPPLEVGIAAQGAKTRTWCID